MGRYGSSEMRVDLRLGDCLDILPTLEAGSVDAVITDPPYNLSMSQKSALHREFQRISRGIVIVFSPPENQWILPASQYLFWVKPISTKNTSRRYSRFVEMIFVYGGSSWNSERHWSQYTNVFVDLVDAKGAHPHRKPPSLIRRLVLNHTNEGDTVLDPFMGSATTGTAALELGRNFIGIELDETYFALAQERLAAAQPRLL